jgi:hypothetical protein
MEMQRKRSGPETLRGAWRRHIKDSAAVGLPHRPLREFARKTAAGTAAVVLDKTHTVVLDAIRWLQAKGGGSPEERKARALRRKERKATNFALKQAKRSKGSLKPSGDGGDKKKKGKGR